VRIGARLASLTEEQRVDMYLRVRGVMERIGGRPLESPGIVYRSVRRWFEGPSTPDVTIQQPPQQPEPAVRHDEAVWVRYARAIAAYVPKDYDGSVAAIVAREVVNTAADPIPGWRGV